MSENYVVNIDYVGQDKTAVAAGDRVAAGLAKIQGRIDRVNAGLGIVTGGMQRIALGVGATLFGAATTGAVAFGRSLISLGSNLEDTNLAIGAMLQANGATGSWAESMQFSQRAMAQIRADAAALPGEAQDYVNIFRSGLAGMLQSGLDTAGAVRMADRVGAVAAMLQVDSQQAGRDLALMLGGRAGAQVRLWTAIQAQVGKTAHEFNQLSATQRRVLLDRALDHYNDAIGASGRTWSALTGTVNTFAQDALRAFGGPFYDLAKHKMEALVAYIGTHGTEITRRLEQWGVQGAGAFERIYERAANLFDFLRANWRTIGHEAAQHGRELLDAYAGMQAIRAFNGIGGPKGMVSFANWLRGSSSAATGAAGAARAGAAVGEGASAAAASASVIGLGAAAIVAATGIAAMTLAVHEGMVDWNGTIAEIRPQLEGLRTHLGELWEASKPLVTMYGTLLIGSLTKLAEGVVRVVDIFVQVATVASTVVSGVTRMLSYIPAGLINPVSGGGVGGISVDRNPREGLDAPVPYMRHSATSRPGDRQRPASPAGHTTIHNHFVIEQADNPERVAVTVQHVMERELRHPTQAAFGGRQRLRP